MITLTYTGTDEDNAREWRLIHARDAHLKTVPEERRVAIQQAKTVCQRCKAETAVAVRCHECGDWLNAATNPDTDAAEAAIVAADAEIAANATVTRLIPFDEELVGVLKRCEDLLLRLDNGEDLPPEEMWDLPSMFADRIALDALGTVIEQLRPHLPWHGDEPDRPRILGPDGCWEHMGLRVVRLDPTAIATLKEAGRICVEAKYVVQEPTPSERQTNDLLDLLDQIESYARAEEHHPLHSEVGNVRENGRAAVSPLLRLITVLTNVTDATLILSEVIDGRQDDIVLTELQDRHYRANALVMVKALTSGDPLHLYLY